MKLFGSSSYRSVTRWDLGWQDRALTQVGTVSQTVDFVLLLRGFCEAVIYEFEGV